MTVRLKIQRQESKCRTLALREGNGKTKKTQRHKQRYLRTMKIKFKNDNSNQKSILDILGVPKDEEGKSCSRDTQDV